MLTLEESQWNLKGIQILSILNLVPLEIEIGADGAKIQRQSSKIRLGIWKTFYLTWLAHCFYIFVRLIQSTILEPEKYFRWDYFVLHFAAVFCYGALFVNGFCAFQAHPSEFITIFNYIFMKRENSLAKRIRMNQIQAQNQNQDGKIKGGKGNQKKRFQGGKGKMFKPVPHPNLDQDQVELQNGGSASRSQIPKSDTGTAVRPLLSWPPKYSLDELVAKFMMFPCLSTPFVVTVIFAIDPTRPQLLYSALPPEWQNIWSFLSLLSVDFFSLTIFCVNSFAPVIVQVMFFSKCLAELEQLNLQLRNLKDKFQNGSFGVGGRVQSGSGGQDTEEEIFILRQILEEMKELVVFIELFNRCFPFCIFALKIACLNCVTLYFFFAIRHFHDFPFLASFCTYLAVDITLVYCVMYRHGFSIPEKTEELKTEFLMTAQKITSASETESFSTRPSQTPNSCSMTMAEMKREIKGIQDVEIKVGNFYILERQSTPNFIDFVLNNVVSLLVSF